MLRITYWFIYAYLSTITFSFGNSRNSPTNNEGENVTVCDGECRPYGNGTGQAETYREGHSFERKLINAKAFPRNRSCHARRIKKEWKMGRI